MIPDIDALVGISIYTTKFAGIGGKIRVRAEDFVVSEVLSAKAQKSIKESGDYAVYVLKKTGIDTRRAIADIFEKRHIRLKSLGLKDSSAMTVQTLCASRKGKAVRDIDVGKYSMRCAGYVKRPLSGRDMIANHFKIRIDRCGGGLDMFDEQDCILNFYGYQRFGSRRPVTHLIGKSLVQRDFEMAVQLILAYVSPFESTEDAFIRSELADYQNYEKMINVIPSWMDVEKIVLREMIRHKDPYRAVRAIPLSLKRLYVSAYQSYIFNLSLSMAYLDGEDLFVAKQGDVCYDADGSIRRCDGFYNNNNAHTDTKLSLSMPFVGHSYYHKTRFNPQIMRVLKDEGVRPRDFFIKEMQEASDPGGFRQSSIRCSDFGVDDTSFYSSAVVQFSVQRGAFATMVLREIIKPEDPIAAGF